jgi:hypothetical protein
MARPAREIVTGGVRCVQENESVLDAAKKMQQLDVGALSMCGSADRLKGMLTDRDSVVKVLPPGKHLLQRPGGGDEWSASCSSGHRRRAAVLGGKWSLSGRFDVGVHILGPVAQ